MFPLLLVKCTSGLAGLSGLCGALGVVFKFPSGAHLAFILVMSSRCGCQEGLGLPSPVPPKALRFLPRPFGSSGQREAAQGRRLSGCKWIEPAACILLPLTISSKASGMLGDFKLNQHVCIDKMAKNPSNGYNWNTKKSERMSNVKMGPNHYCLDRLLSGSPWWEKESNAGKGEM